VDGAADAARGDVIEAQSGKAIKAATAARWIHVLDRLAALAA